MNDTKNDADRIVELFEFYPSDTLKSEQTRFTKTANSILRDAVNSRLNVLFSQREIDVLTQAAGILNDLKHKITHAKEIRQREERKQKAHRAKCEASQEALVNSLFPKTDTPADKLYTVGLWLALSVNYKDITGPCYHYIPEHRFLAKMLERALSKEHHFTIQTVVDRCRLEIRELLVDSFWSLDEPGNASDIQKIQDLYHSRWQHQRAEAHLTFLSRVRGELMANAFVDGIKKTVTT